MCKLSYVQVAIQRVLIAVGFDYIAGLWGRPGWSIAKQALVSQEKRMQWSGSSEVYKNHSV